jgi:hypothetical protein
MQVGGCYGSRVLGNGVEDGVEDGVKFGVEDGVVWCCEGE